MPPHSETTTTLRQRRKSELDRLSMSTVLAELNLNREDLPGAVDHEARVTEGTVKSVEVYEGTVEGADALLAPPAATETTTSRRGSMSHFCCQHLPFSYLPPWLQDNEFLQTRHRPPLNSYTKCLKSIFSLHSETGNIWSHLIGFKIYTALAYSFWSSIDVSIEEKLVFSSFFAGVIACMGFSTLFHTFCCHSQRVGGFFVRLDYCGISLLIMAGFFPWIYYGFYCERTARNVYSVLSLVSGSICLAMSFTEYFNDPRARNLRTFVFTSCGLVYLVPAVHFLVLHGLDDPVAQRAFVWLSRVTFVCLLKATIYACRIPERWMPGRCDIWFQSHQIFHVLVVVGTLVNYFGVRELSAYRMSLSPGFCNATTAAVL